MSTVPAGSVPAPVPPPPVAPGGTEPPPEGTAQKVDFLVVYGHSNLLYWWPVWLVSFVLAIVTYTEGNQMAVVPDGSDVAVARQVEGFAGPRDVIVAPEGKSIPLAPHEQAREARMTVSGNNSLGVVFVATLFVVALTSTILLRGLVSIIALAMLLIVAVSFALLDWWTPILAFVGGLDIRMNAAGYLAVGIPLFLAWVVVVMFYDRAQYIVFDQGQIRYVREVGDSEVVIQSEGAIVEKKRNDIFRHWLLGFGTGDLLIRTGGGHGQTIELENVLNIGRKLTIVNQMIREKAITIEG